MESIDITFSRTELAFVLDDVRTFRPNVNTNAAWVYKTGKGRWEFHFENFYWHGRADNAYDARSRGWSAWLEKLVPGYLDGTAASEREEIRL